MRARKSDLKKLVSQRKRTKQLADMKMNQTIREMLEHTADSNYGLDELLNETDALAILNRAKVNNFLNLYISRIFDSLSGIEALNNRLLQKIMKKKELVSPSDLSRIYIKSRELENEQLRLVKEFVQAQEVKLDIPEQNMVIIYRSLPDQLKNLMYTTVMEFVRKCPAIQRELKNQKENAAENQQ